MVEIFGEISEKYETRVVQIHLDSKNGTPFWIDATKEYNINPEDISCVQDLKDKNLTLLNPKLREKFDNTLRYSPRKLIPKSSLNNRIIYGESGGTTGTPKVGPFPRKEWDEGIIDPLVRILKEYANAPKDAIWASFVPQPPHTIGYAAHDMFEKMNGFENRFIDLDPGFFKILGMNMQKYGDVFKMYGQTLGKRIKNKMEMEGNPKIVFTTGKLVERFQLYGIDQKILDNVEVVILGGTSVSADNYNIFRNKIFPNAYILNIYGSGIFGPPGIQFPLGENDDRIIYTPFKIKDSSIMIDMKVVNEKNEEVGFGEQGRVVTTKLSIGMFAPEYPEEDLATKVRPPEEYEKKGINWNCLEDIVLDPNKIKAGGEAGCY